MKWNFPIRLSLLGLAVLILAACGTASTPQPVGPATPPAPSAPPASPTLAAVAANTPAAQATATAVISPTATGVLTATSRTAPTAAQTATTAVTRTAATTAVVTATKTITATRGITATAVATATKSVVPPNPAAVPNVEIFATGLDTPWAIAFAPDGRIFITERAGRIRVIKDGKLLAEPWMTLDVNETGEAGLLGLALDPEFAKNRYVYVAYTDRSPEGGLRNRLVRLREDPATGKGVMDKVLIDNVPANTYHDGGRVKFGPDGKLYWTMGDAGNMPSAQDLKTFSGKILRLNPDGNIPADNPIAGSPIYSYGHRNPQGLAWQPETKRLYATEHGPSGEKGCCQDEVNLIESGKNYGWPTITGDQKRAGMVSPVIQSTTSETWAPTGATFVTSGPWRGALLFTGLRGQTLYRLTLDPVDPAKTKGLDRLFAGQYGRLRDVAEGPDGAIYILTSNGDGRGNLPPDGDRVLRLTFAQ
ncbi:MAG: PQQ-dependent sugar dehydrogenase [Anaerolineae bacterium]|nr:PQQ-dependent sugar dehydrogenase [Anaerolineae bacterium]